VVMKIPFFVLVICLLTFSLAFADSQTVATESGDFIAIGVSSSSGKDSVNTIALFDTEKKYVWYYNAYGSKSNTDNSKWKFKDLSEMQPKSGLSFNE
ncbi:hypothetical protein ACFL0T_06930, partial [Candidatus Omnitrophota bacterium]